MEVGILGPLDVTVGGEKIPIASAAQRSLLALLAIRPGAVVPADRLADGLYGDDLPSNVANALQSRVSRLRRLLGSDAIVGERSGYVLAIDPDRVDAVRFERLVRDARAASDLGQSAELFREALDLWRGPALVDALDVDAARAEASRLNELRLAAFEARVAVDLALGWHAEVIPELQAAAAEQPGREGLVASLMHALYRAGRQAEALAAYQELRRHLAEELGLDPSSELRDLEAKILRQDADLLPAHSASPFPSTSATPAAPRRPTLPAPLTTLVGRDAALRDVTELLETKRLVTVTGPGGAGKTRLAVEVAARQTAADGVWFVELASILDHDVEAAIGRAFGVKPTDLPAFLVDKEPLLVLDNCEHVLDTVAAFAAALLSAAPGLRILATSREPLNIAGEVQWPLPPLALDDAARLFADRAKAVQPTFTSSDLEDAVADICRRLDGLPLAIELAAARVKTFTVSDIADRLDGRFRLLTGGSRTALPRHQTLRALVDWSYDLLFDDQRTLFEHLSVFPAGFALDAVEAIAGHAGLDTTDAADLLTQLVDKSLVQREANGRTSRYRMLETLREYGQERLRIADQLDAARRGQARWCLAMAEAAAEELEGPAIAEWLDRLVDVELDNVRPAMAWAKTDAGDADLAVRLATAYARAMWERGHQLECRAWIEDALAMPDAATLPPAVRATAIIWLSAVTSDHDRPAARRMAEEGLLVAGKADDPSLRAAAQVNLAQALVDAGKLDDAAAFLEEAAPFLSGWRAGWCDEVACYVALGQGDLTSAESACRRSLERFQALGNAWSEGRMRHKLAIIQELRRDYTAAIEHYEVSIALARPLGVHEIVAVRLGQLSRVLSVAGEDARAIEVADEADALLHWLSGVDGSGRVARRRSDLALARGELTDALGWCVAVDDADGAAFMQALLQRITDLT